MSEQRTDGEVLLFRRRSVETVGADALEAFGQDVLEQTANEFVAVEAQLTGLAGGAFGVANGDLLAVVVEDALFGEGRLGDVAGEGFDGVAAVARFADVADPGGAPDGTGNRGVDRWMPFSEHAFHADAQVDGEAFERQEERGITRSPPCPFGAGSNL